VKWLALAGVLVAIGHAAHQAGSRLARFDVERLEAAARQAQATERELRQLTGQLRAERDTARAALLALQERHDREVPRGVMADVMQQVRARLDGGLTPARVAEALARAEPVTRCDGPVVARRFRIGTGPRGAEEDGTSFAEGMITVRAMAPVGGADPAETMVVTLSGLGVEGGRRTITGLPAEAILALGNMELRLTVAPSGLAGFATASLATCRPG
jgi:hypothetical protein